MYNGISICHFPYRNSAENVYYFAENGFDAICQHGLFFLDAISDPTSRAEFTKALRDTGVRFTVHHLLPTPAKAYSEEDFTEHIKAFRSWQEETGLLWNLSFDVYPDIRPTASRYIRIVLDIFKGTDTRVSVEDYGLSCEELQDLEPLRAYPNFGYLVDLGHMNVRLHNTGRKWGHAALEQWGEGAPLPPGNGSPEAFENAVRSKTFPVFEFHLHNNSGQGDEHRWLEEGVIDMQGIARMLKKLEPDAVVTLEVVPDWTGTPEEIAQQKEAEQAVWQHLDKHYRLIPFTGKPDPARDARYLRSFAFWKDCLENA